MISKNIEIIGFDYDTDLSNLLKFELDSKYFKITQNNNSNILCSEPFSNNYYLLYKQQMVFEYHVHYHPYLLLKSNYKEGANYNSHIERFVKSDYLIIIIDGTIFKNTIREQVIKVLQRKCVRIINPYISAYSDKNNGYVLPISFLITKSYEYKNHYDKQAVSEIMHDAFNSLFTENTNGNYIVSIDKSTSKSIKIPILIGLDKAFISTTVRMKNTLEKDKKYIEDQISDQQKFINMHNNRVLKILSKKEAEKAQSKIYELRSNISNKELNYKNNSIWEQDKYYKSDLSKELNINIDNLIFGFTNELKYPIIDSKNIKHSNNKNKLTTKYYIILLILIGLSASIIPNLSCIVLLGIQIWYLIKNEIKRNILAYITICYAIAFNNTKIDYPYISAYILIIGIIVAIVKKKNKK